MIYAELCPRPGTSEEQREMVLRTRKMSIFLLAQSSYIKNAKHDTSNDFSYDLKDANAS